MLSSAATKVLSDSEDTRRYINRKDQVGVLNKTLEPSYFSSLNQKILLRIKCFV